MSKELTITPPEGYEIDKEKSTFEKIVFKPIDTKPKSWKEYWKNSCKNKAFQGVSFVQGLVDDKNATFHCNGVIHQISMNIELSEAFLALMKLISLRQAWIGDWKPNWSNLKQDKKWCVHFNADDIIVEHWLTMSRPLSFPTKEMAEEFLNCFRDLIEQAKELI